MMIEQLSIDLSNYCSKQCPFCYNHSTQEGNVLWQPSEVIDFASDCIGNGVKAISLGGGEPLEYDGIFDIINALQPLAYLSVTTNGLPLLDKATWERLMQNAPDKLHITIHNPDNSSEVDRVIRQIRALSDTQIKPGVNLLIAKNKIEYARATYRKMLAHLSPDQIILVPQRFSNTPSPKDLATVSDGRPFQSPSCLLGCKPPQKFCSVSWDKKVNHCSYAGGKQSLNELNYKGLIEALNKVTFYPCLSVG